MKTLLIALVLLQSSCVWLGGNGKTPIKDTDSNIKPVTHDSVLAAEAEKLSNPLARIARSIYAGNDMNVAPGPVTLQGSGNTGNYMWYQQSGPSKVVFSDPKILKPTVTLVSGKYFFLLTGSYNGRNYRDSVKVTVSGTVTPPVDSVPPPPPPVNKIPTVNAGPDKTITLPVNTVQLNAVATDPEGGVITYKWSTGETTATINPKYTLPGSFNYSITVTDDKGASATDNVVVLVLPAIVDVPPTTGTNADPTTPPKIFNDFETSITTGFNSWIQQAYDGKAPGPMLTLSTEQKASGSKSAKFVVNSGYTQKTGQAHTQITQIDVASIKEGEEHWYSNDYYLVSPYPTDIQYLRQWHHDRDDGSPPLALCTQGGKLQLNYYTGYPNGKDVFYDAGTYPLNKWFHVTMHVKFSSNPALSLTEVWIDGVKTASRGDANMFAGINNITMFGLYKWIWKLTSYSSTLTTTIYADNYKEW